MLPILIVTRPMDAAERFVAKVKEAAGIELNVLISPLFKIEPLNVDLSNEEFQHLILTSSNGAYQAKRLGVTTGTPTWCVGKATTKVAKELGFDARFAGESANKLTQTLQNRAPNGQMLHLSGVHTRGQVVERLTQAGMLIKRISIYDQVACTPTKDALAAFAGRHPIVLPVFSPRSACLLSEQKVSAPMHLIAMSSAVKSAFSNEQVLNSYIVERPTEEEMVKATVKVLIQLS